MTEHLEAEMQAAIPPRHRLNLKLSVIAVRTALLEIARLHQAEAFWREWQARPGMQAPTP